MKILKRVFAYLLCLALVLTLAPTAVFAAGAEVAATGATTVRYNDSSSVLSGFDGGFGIVGHSVTYNLNIAETLYYELSIEASVFTGGAAVSFTVNDEEIYAGKELNYVSGAGNSGNNDMQKTKTSMGGFQLPAGENTVKITVTRTSMSVYQPNLVITPVSLQISATEETTLNYDQTDSYFSPGATAHSMSKGGYWEWMFSAPAGAYGISFKATIFDSTTYIKVTLDNEVLAEKKLIENSGGSQATVTTFITNKKLDAGVHTVRVESIGTESANDIWYPKAITAPIPPAKRVSTIASEYPRGTDAFTLEYDGALDASTLSGICVKDGEGEKLASTVSLDASKKIVTLILNETLGFDSSYTLEIAGVKDEMGAAAAEESVSFTTGGSQGDTATDSVEITEFKIANETATVKGVIKGSMGQTISGRSAKLFIAAPESAEAAIGSVAVSASDGTFTISSAVSGDTSGDFTARVETEYGAEDTDTEFYVPEAAIAPILEELSKKTTADAVEEYLTTDEVKTNLQIDPVADTAGITDTDKVFERLIGLDADSAGEFKAAYNAAIAIEKINQAASETEVAAVLSDSATCAALGIDKAKYDALEEEYKAQLAANIFAADSYSEATDLEYSFNIEFENALKEQLGISDIMLTDGTASGTAGEEITLSVKSSEAKAFTKAEFTLTFDDRVKNSISGVTAGSANVSGSGGVYTVTVTGTSAATDNLADVSFISAKAGSAAVTVNGSVTLITTLGYEVKTEITEKVYYITVNAALSGAEPVEILFGSKYGNDIKVNDTANGYADYSSSIELHTGNYVTITHDLETTGIYTLTLKHSNFDTNGTNTISATVNGAAELTNVVTNSTGQNDVVDTVLGFAKFNAGKNTIELRPTSTGAKYWLRALTLTPVSPAELLSVTIGGKLYADRVEFARGADNIVLNYSGAIDADSLSGITLKDSSGAELSVSAAQDGNSVVISLSETLNFGARYTLSLSGISDAFGNSLADESFSFVTVSGAAGDEGSDRAEITSFTIENGTATVTGKAYGSTGAAIAGRKVTLFIDEPNTDKEEAAVVTSTADGAFTVSCSVTGTVSGTYYASACSEYGIEGQQSEFYYVPEAIASAIWSALKSASTADDVLDILEQYEADLAIDLDADFAGLKDPDKAYERLAGIEVSNITEFTKSYNVALAVEKTNQAESSAAVEAVLKNSDYLSALGIDSAKLDALTDSAKAELYEIIFDEDTILSGEAYAAVFEEAFNTALKAQAALSDISLLADDSAVYIGQAAELAIVASAPVTGIKEITLIFTFADSAKDALFDFTAETKLGTVTTQKTENVYTVKISDIAQDAEITELVKISFACSEAVNADFTVSGTAQAASGTDYDAALSILSQDFEAEVKEKESDNKVSGGGGGGGGGSSVKLPAAAVPPASGEIKDSSNAAQSEYIDLENVAWAAPYINRLLARRVVTMPDEGRFYPERDVTRAEFTKMVVLAFDLYMSSLNEFVFSDVSENDWYYGYIKAAYDRGVVLGGDNGEFRPNDFVTREEMCTMISRVIDLPQEGGAEAFADDSDISEYAKAAVYGARSAGIINGMGDNIFDPKANSTRAMAAKVICGMLGEDE